MKKTIFYLFLLGCAIFKPNKNIFGQNLQFNQAVFNTYGPGNADGNQSTPMFTGSLVVGANQVLKITSVNCSSINAILGGSTSPQLTLGILGINDFHYMLSTSNQMEVWLPTGSYTIKGFELANASSGVFKGMISGILYDIVP
jgi:hypothetical protein